jgi:hypothetical protein
MTRKVLGSCCNKELRWHRRPSSPMGNLGVDAAPTQWRSVERAAEERFQRAAPRPRGAPGPPHEGGRAVVRPDNSGREKGK